MPESSIRLTIPEMAQEISWTRNWNESKIRTAISNQLKPMSNTPEEELMVRLWEDITSYPIHFSVYFKDTGSMQPMVGDGCIHYNELIITLVREPSHPRFGSSRRISTLPSIKISKELQESTTLYNQSHEEPTKFF